MGGAARLELFGKLLPSIYLKMLFYGKTGRLAVSPPSGGVDDLAVLMARQPRWPSSVPLH
jgi:hypothetical protein